MLLPGNSVHAQSRIGLSVPVRRCHVPDHAWLSVEVHLLLLAAMIAMVGCRREQAAPSPGNTTARPEGAIGMTGSPTDSLRVELEVPSLVRTGDQVPMTIRVRNTGDKQTELYLAGRPIAFDISITGADNSLVWRRLEGQTIPAILRVKTLRPGEILELRDVWDQRTHGRKPTDAGIYRVQGTILSDSPTPLQTPVAVLRIEDR